MVMVRGGHVPVPMRYRRDRRRRSGPSSGDRDAKGRVQGTGMQRVGARGVVLGCCGEGLVVTSACAGAVFGALVGAGVVLRRWRWTGVGAGEVVPGWAEVGGWDRLVVRGPGYEGYGWRFRFQAATRRDLRRRGLALGRLSGFWWGLVWFSGVGARTRDGAGFQVTRCRG